MALIIDNTEVLHVNFNNIALMQIVGNGVPVWVSPLVLTGRLVAVSETFLKYHNLDNGKLQVYLTNITNEFIKRNGSYKIQIYVSGYAAVTRYVTVDDLYEVFTGIAGPQDKVVCIYDMNAQDVGLERWKQYTDIRVGFNDSSRTTVL